MSETGAEVRSRGGTHPCRFYAACDFCGWANPKGGMVQEHTAAAYADEHNRETHGAAA